MLGNILKLFAKAPEYLIAEVNDLYRKSMQRLLFIIFGYLGLMWGLSTFMGTGAIAMGMWGFIIVFTFFYWQPSLGGLGALVEWMNKSDDPKSKSTWRLYLMVIIAAIVVGEAAITLNLLEVRYQFPIVVLVLFTYVLIALLIPGSDLDKWLPYIGFVMLTIAVMGTYHEMNPSTNAQREAKVIASKDVAIQDARLVSNLAYVSNVMNCNIKNENMATWSPDQTTAYNLRCDPRITNRGITLLELEEYWPNEYKVWVQAQQKISAGMKIDSHSGQSQKTAGGASNPTSTMDKMINWAKENPVYALFIVILHIPVIWIVKKWWNRNDEPTKESTKSSTVSESGSYWGWFWIITIGLVLYLAYQYRDAPEIARIIGTDSASVQTGSQFVPSVSALEYDKWVPQFRSVNQHKVIPQDAWHGRNVQLKKDSFLTDTLNMVVVFDPTDERLNINLTGKCAVGTRNTPKVCDGYWHAGNGVTGVYRLEWERNGRYFLINMYEEQSISSSYKQLPIKELLVQHVSRK